MQSVYASGSLTSHQGTDAVETPREAGPVAALTEDQVEKAALPTAMADWLALPLNVSAVFVTLGWQIPLFIIQICKRSVSNSLK